MQDAARHAAQKVIQKISNRVSELLLRKLLDIWLQFSKVNRFRLVHRFRISMVCRLMCGKFHQFRFSGISSAPRSTIFRVFQVPPLSPAFPVKVSKCDETLIKMMGADEVCGFGAF